MADLPRRRFLASTGAGLIGCSLAASPFVTPVTLAAAPGENRLVVIILRGAMDGLGVLQPYGDPMLARHRPTLASDAAARAAAGAGDLDGFYALHPGLQGLLPLWRAGELAFVQAVSTPYRDKRSHFDGQDVLENGGPDSGGALTPARDGWLNRLLPLLPGATAETAFAVGRESLLILRGAAPAGSWSPDSELALSPQGARLLERLYAGDPLFADAADTALALSSDRAAERMGGGAVARAGGLARFAAERLRAETRIAAFSLGGWDTHRNQDRAIRGALRQLEEALLTLRSALGPVWGRTAVLAITEFGRTVRENGNRGTDHGTAGAMLLAGGALSGARVHGRWPGLGEADLYRDRDLMPTDDLRRYAAWALRALFSAPVDGLERSVFPGIALGTDPGLMA